MSGPRCPVTVLIFLQILDEFCNVKFCIDASQADVGSWLKYIRFAGCQDQHNLVACQVDDQVCAQGFLVFLWEHWSSSEARGIKATVSCSSPSWLACWRGEVPHTDVGDAEQNPLQGYCLGVVYSLCAGLHPKWSSFLTAIEWFGNPTFLCLLPFTVFSTITVDLFMECTELIKNV